MNRQQRENLAKMAGATRGIGAPPPGDPATREWKLEHLLEHPALRGAATADANLSHNPHAKQALLDLRSAIAGLHAATDGHQNGGDAA